MPGRPPAPRVLLARRPRRRERCCARRCHLAAPQCLQMPAPRAQVEGTCFRFSAGNALLPGRPRSPRASLTHGPRRHEVRRVRHCDTVARRATLRTSRVSFSGHAARPAPSRRALMPKADCAICPKSKTVLSVFRRHAGNALPLGGPPSLRFWFARCPHRRGVLLRATL